MNKPVSIFIGSVNDHVNDINGEVIDMSVTDLVAAQPETYSLVQNPNGQTDLAFEIDMAIAAVRGNFTETSTSNLYKLMTEDYVGGQPKTRCPQCPA